MVSAASQLLPQLGIVLGSLWGGGLFQLMEALGSLWGPESPWGDEEVRL